MKNINLRLKNNSTFSFTERANNLINQTLSLRKKNISNEIMQKRNKRLLEEYKNEINNENQNLENKFKLEKENDNYIYNYLTNSFDSNNEEKILNALLYFIKFIFPKSLSNKQLRYFLLEENFKRLENILKNTNNLEILLNISVIFSYLSNTFIDFRKYLINNEFILLVLSIIENKSNDNLEIICNFLNTIGFTISKGINENLSFVFLYEIKCNFIEKIIILGKSIFFKNDINVRDCVIFNLCEILKIPTKNKNYNLINIKILIPILLEYVLNADRNINEETSIFENCLNLLQFLTEKEELKQFFIENNNNNNIIIVVFKLFSYFNIFNNNDNNNNNNIYLPLTDENIEYTIEIIINLLEEFIKYEEFFILLRFLIKNFRFINTKHIEVYLLILKLFSKLLTFNKNEKIINFILEDDQNILNIIFKYYIKNNKTIQIVYLISFNLFDFDCIKNLKVFNNKNIFKIILNGLENNENELKIFVLEYVQKLIEKINELKLNINIKEIFIELEIKNKIENLILNNNENEKINIYSNEIINYLNSNLH